MACTPGEIAFDIHNLRHSGEYRNVDLIAVDWLSQKRVELVAVEVKLEFTPKLVQQAHHYTRFADRVWIAVPIPPCQDHLDHSLALRSQDQSLYDHVVELGIGIIVCRRSKGGSYEVFPVHWPKLLNPRPVEKDEFLECYREQFEESGVLAPKRRDRPVI